MQRVVRQEANRRVRLSWIERHAHPFLQWPLVHFLVSNPWWTVTVLVIGLAALAMGAALLKIWTGTPPGFRPVVRVSALDLIQARSLRRTAEAAELAGDHEAALTAWLGAIGQNVGDIDLLRRGLAAVIRHEDADRRKAARFLSQTAWLLRLGRTNEIDVQIAGQVFRKYERWAELEALLQPRLGQLDSQEEKDYLSALFWLGRIDEFGQAWERSRLPLTNDPALRLCRIAHQVAWEAPEQAAEGRRLLGAALEDSALLVPAHRANLVVAAALLDPIAYEKSLHRLEEARSVRLADLTGYWRLLANAGRIEEARRAAEDYLLPPVMPWDVLDLASAYVDLGLPDRACRFLRRYASQFSNSPAGWSISIWVTYANLLLELRRWDDLIDLGLTVRQLPTVMLALRGYVYFLEGRAFEARQHTELATASFEHASREDYPVPELGLQVGLTLLQLGYPVLAGRVLVRIERDLAEDPRVWQGLYEVAFLLKKDSVGLFKAAQAAYRLAPQETICLNNYAAALLVNRWQPGEAVKRTLELLDRQPDLLEARINHAFALAQSRRFDEARAVLSVIDANRLDGSNRTAYHLASFEIDLNLSRFPEARAHLAEIDRAHLFPNQVEWLNRMRNNFPAK